MIMDKLSEKVKKYNNNKTNQDDHDSMDFEDKKVDQQVTVGNAVPYCQHCLNKSNETFRINNDESIRICCNMACTKADRAQLNAVVTYDSNNNQNEKSLFKYSDEIKKMNSKELMEFFEKDMSSVPFYQDLNRIFKQLLPDTENQNKPVENEINLAPSITSINEKPITTELMEQNAEDFLFTDNSSDPINPQLNMNTMTNPLNLLDDPLAFQAAPLLPANQVNVTEFDDSFFMESLPVIWDNNTDSNLITIETNYPDQNSQATYATLNTVDHNDLSQMFDMTDLFLDTNIEYSVPVLETNTNETAILNQQVEPETNTSQPVIVTEINQTICDKRSATGGSRIKITKLNQINEINSIKDDLKLQTPIKAVPTPTKPKSNFKTDKRQYDSIGENEDSSDNLLPWEVKSNKKKKEKTKYSTLELMSNSRTPKRDIHQSPNLKTPTITKADLSLKSSEQKSNIFEKGTPLKKALLESDGDKTTKISQLFNKSNLIKASPIGKGETPKSGSYKDLVLNVLKKKTKV